MTTLTASAAGSQRGVGSINELTFGEMDEKNRSHTIMVRRRVLFLYFSYISACFFTNHKMIGLEGFSAAHLNDTVHKTKSTNHQHSIKRQHLQKANAGCQRH